MRIKYCFVCCCVALSGCLPYSTENIKELVYRGNISGYGYDEYRLSLRKNDQLLSCLDANNLEAIIYSPESLTLENNRPVTVNKDGEYIIRVLMKSAFARRGSSGQV